jgi:uncharacterized protein YqeY
MIKQQLDQEIKAALLSGDKDRATTLRGLKSVILYAEVAESKREEGLSDDAILVLFAKEAKKRQESADFFTQGGNLDAAKKELEEKVIIEAYLPAQLTDDELVSIVDAAIRSLDNPTPQSMGQVIAQVKKETEGKADGSRIAKMAKERLMSK